jgi:hypothetical protein
VQTALQPAFRVPILSTSSGFGSRGKYCNRSTEIKKYKKKGKRENRNSYTDIRLSDQAHVPTEDTTSLSADRVYRFLEARLILFLRHLFASAMGLFRPAHLGLKEMQRNQKQYNNEFLRCEIRDHVSRCMQRSTQHRAPITCS